MQSQKRIDQFLFKNIVRQSYEAYYVWQVWLKKYREESKVERDAYETFSRKMKNLIGFGKTDNEINLKIVDLWIDLSECEKEKLIKESKNYREIFGDVQRMMEVYSHTMM